MADRGAVTFSKLTTC